MNGRILQQSDPFAEENRNSETNCHISSFLDSAAVELEKKF